MIPYLFIYVIIQFGSKTGLAPIVNVISNTIWVQKHNYVNYGEFYNSFKFLIYDILVNQRKLYCKDDIPFVKLRGRKGS